MLGTGLQVEAGRRVMAVGQACCANSIIVWVITLCVGDVPPGVIVYGGPTRTLPVIEGWFQMP